MYGRDINGQWPGLGDPVTAGAAIGSVVKGISSIFGGSDPAYTASLNRAKAAVKALKAGDSRSRVWDGIPKTGTFTPLELLQYLVDETKYAKVRTYAAQALADAGTGTYAPTPATPLLPGPVPSLPSSGGVSMGLLVAAGAAAFLLLRKRR